MTLEIRVYKELESTESKVMWGMSWRQMAAAAMMIGVTGLAWLLFWHLLHAPELGQYVVFAANMPLAVWGWARPKGLKPEVWIIYASRQKFGQHRYLIDGQAAHHAIRADHKAERNP